MTSASTQHENRPTITEFHDYRSLGWTPAEFDGQLVAPAGTWFDMVAMPAVIADSVLVELAIAMMPAAAIHDYDQRRTGVLTAPCLRRPLAVPNDLRAAKIEPVPSNAPVPLPDPRSRRYRWLRSPDQIRQPPLWTTVVAITRRVLHAAQP
ncbi:hypothetical protein [Actinokineospora sp. NPDC004072]